MNSSNSFIETGAKIGDNVTIGPFCSIGKNVKISNNCKLHSHVNIQGDVTIGENTEIFPFSSIGTIPQDLKYVGEKTFIKIGDNCKIREYVTINLGTAGGGGVTSISDNCLLMVGTHIAHDCRIGKNVIFANHSTLAGHVIVEDDVVVGALSAIHQFSRIGEGAMIGGMSGVTADVVPYATVMGNRANVSGLNIIGLKRRKIPKDEINALRKVFRYIFYHKNKTFKLRVEEMQKNKTDFATINKLLNFLLDNSQRSYCLVN